MNRSKSMLLYTVCLLYWIGLYTYPSILPNHINEIVGNLSMTGVILSMYGLLQVFFRLPFGILSDFYSKHKVFAIVGLTALGIGSLVLYYAKNATGLIIGRAITGVGATTWVPLSALAFRSNPKNSLQLSSILTFISNLGSIIGVSLTPILVSSNNYSPAFISSVILAALSIGLIFFFRTGDAKATSLTKHDITNTLLDLKIILPGILFALIQLGNFTGTFTFIPIVSKQIGLPTSSLSLIMNVYFISSMALNLLTPRLQKLMSPKAFLITPFILMVLGLLALMFANSSAILYLSQFLIGCSYGMSFPVLMDLAVKYTNASNRTIALGMFQSTYAIGMFLGPLVSAGVYEKFGMQMMVIIVSLIIMISYFVIYSSYERSTTKVDNMN